ncbi:MAG TPA: ATP-binding protein [Jatrophihabitans sp.]|nr:ATP-binding protein [Jatrophihabitans sp.]
MGDAVRTFAARHLLAIVVLLVVSGLAVGTCLALRGVVRSQEKRLLDERATEIAASLTSSTTQTAATLHAAGQAVALDGPSSPLFTGLATPLTITQNRPNGTSVGVAQATGGQFITSAAVGKGLAAGKPVDPSPAQVLARARGARDLVFDVIPAGRVNRVVEAINVPHASKPTVAFLESTLSTRPVHTKPDSPYRELNAVLYAGGTADPDRLVLIFNSVPTGSLTAHRTIPIGADSALIVISPNSPLVGSFAHSVPWIVLAVGVLLALLLTLLVEVLSRRRVYALNLVEQRTRAMHQAQMTAEAANRSKSEFLSRMSHELRTPLNAVLGFSQLLELDELTPDQEQAVDQITKGGRHLLDLINEILDISQIETGKLALSPEAVNVGDLVGEAVDLVRPLAAERGIHLLGNDTDSCDAYVFADRQRLKQILLNLLGNAIKYNREGGTVSISCARPPQPNDQVAGSLERSTLRIQVTDTGPGIPQEQFHLLFTPFERLGAEHTTVEGTGIGLALSQRLAEVMGATLGVDSTVGRGSTFWVDFPIVEGPVERIERLGELGSTRVVGSDPLLRPAVLHIEDNLSNIQLIERVLAQRPGVSLIPAMQGRLGLELARQHQPVLILLDLNLADVSGEEVLHLLRNDPSTAHIPVAIVSADAMPRQVQRLLAGGATAYLTKPFDVRELLDLVDKSLELLERRTEKVVATPSESGGDLT